MLRYELLQKWILKSNKMLLFFFVHKYVKLISIYV